MVSGTERVTASTGGGTESTVCDVPLDSTVCLLWGLWGVGRAHVMSLSFPLPPNPHPAPTAGRRS